jgi:hypothetical protein
MHKTMDKFEQIAVAMLTWWEVWVSEASNTLEYKQQLLDDDHLPY